MSDKMTCPGCGSHSSDVLADFRDERPCRTCGLSRDAAHEIWAVQRSRADDELKKQLAEEIKRRGIAETQVARLEYRLREIRSALDASDPDWLGARS